MRAVIAPVKNISRFSSAMEAVAANEHRDERMVLIHGATGVGKSTALAYFMNRFNAVYAEASPAWSIGSMLRAIVTAAGHLPKGRAADMERQIVDEMMGEGRPLFIDEMDYLFLPGQQTSLRMLETLHSIHDKSRMPVVMVGMDKIDRKLKLREQIARRIDQWVLFSDLDRDDARAVADHLSEVHIENDLLDLLYAATQGRMGRIRLALAQVERLAKGKKWDRIDAERWGNRPWQLGR
ncbi:MAG: ATP-binding protein [Candidatus Contendobacter sp.]|jgi:DNA transposition AAA+ family ATPase|nr:ATP-binding protein [Candidatus Contendobacter sp.]